MSLRQCAQALTLLLFVPALTMAQSRNLSLSGFHESISTGQRLNLDGICSPWAYPVDAQCSHVQELCPEAATFLSLPHLQGYFCASEASRPFVLLGLLLWLLLLFSTLGICASDFLSPNLSTIAHVLGLDDNVAGVTFLAVGNGSPDLFATFSAMKANSGSLAIGELLGAATFIVSVVVGLMCIIKPFHVRPLPFLRDVGFFTLSTVVIFWILHDGILRRWEVNLLVGLYGLYVCLVIAGTWWEKKRERRILHELTVREEFISDQPFLEAYRDEESSTTINLDVRPSRTRAISTPNPPRASYQVGRRSQSRSPPRLSSVDTAIEPAVQPSLPHFSLLTALEFRDIVSSLQNEANLSTLSVFDNSIGSLGSRHYRTPSIMSHYSTSRRSGTPAQGGLETQLDTEVLSDHFNPDHHNGTTNTPISPVVATPVSQSYVSSGYKHTIVNFLYQSYSILFPHLHAFTKKSFFNLLVAILATPGVVALTLTLPVVPLPHHNPAVDGHSTLDVSVPEGRLIDPEENEVIQALEIQDHVEDIHFNRWLTAIQCVLGPPFCIISLFGLKGYPFWYILVAALAGATAGTLVLIFSDKGNSSIARLARCLMGFFIAVVWIMIIADEVVSVLKAFGLIFNLSDAIIGLTIFAIGNSLADLVANTSIAAFAPIMGFSACFGGPMLNILLGVGVSGSVIVQETGRDYNLHFSVTLLISVISLLTLLVSTLIFVPRNGYLLTRSWGVFLLISYIIIMAISVFAEVKTSSVISPNAT